jgi:hypothetical protein
MADDFVITSSDGSTNGNIDAGAIDGSDTVSLGIALRGGRGISDHLLR